MRALIITLSMAAAVVSGPGAAQSLPAEALIEELILAAAAGVSLDEAVAMVERRFKARVVRADVNQHDGRRVYVLRLLNDAGRVWTVRVDAATGSLL
ncbi:MAG TPA: PepSY domain-containing protein [Steroidobacteraceae bacterium]|nr:PepSY domain-containing protein [Steroidobacteraceae bacterium]